MFKSKNPSQLNLKWVISTKTEEENTRAVFWKAKGMAVQELAQPFRNAHTTAVDILSRAPGFIQANPIQSSERKSRRQEGGGKGGWPLWLETAPWKPCEEMSWQQETLNWIQSVTQGDGKHMPFSSVRRSRAISWAMLTFESELISGGYFCP